MTTTEVASQRAVPARPVRSEDATSRMNWGVTVLLIWVTVGFYLDLWAHARGMVDDTFLTPWQAGSLDIYTMAADGTDVRQVTAEPSFVPEPGRGSLRARR